MLEVHDSLLAECARWNYRTPANWESSAAAIRSALFPARTTQLVGYLRAAGLYPAFDPPSFNQYGGLATNGFQPALASPGGGTIYYTLDGSDPRLPGGGVSPQARVWSPGAVSITQDVTLAARVRSAGGQWSALAQPRYFIATRRVAVSVQDVAGNLQLSFNALPGETYRVEYCTDLALANWQLFQAIPAAQSEVVTLSDPALARGPARFYRVLWMP